MRHRSTPPMTGSIDATAEIASATMPPSHIAATDLQVRERRVAVVHAIGPGAAVADHVHSQLAARRLHGDVHLAGGNPDALGDQLEVVDQGLHRTAHDLGDVLGGVAESVGPELEVGGPRQLLVGDHHRLTGRFSSFSTHCSTILSDSFISPTRIR